MKRTDNYGEEDALVICKDVNATKSRCTVIEAHSYLDLIFSVLWLWCVRPTEFHCFINECMKSQCSCPAFS